jgi:hypothetical protein
MDLNKFSECERKRFIKIINFRLPYRFLIIGIVIGFVSIIMMFIRKFALEGDIEWLRELTKKGLLIGMLLMSISKDKIEDEMTISLRSQSYALAFVIGVIYTLIMPYVEFGVDRVLNPGSESFKDLGGFQILTFMLLIQLMFYHLLKKFN